VQSDRPGVSSNTLRPWPEQRVRLAAATALLLAVGIGAASGQPNLDVEEMASTIPGRLATEHLVVAGIEIGSATLDEVLQHLGPTRVLRLGEAGTVRAVCYQAHDPDDETVLLFQAPERPRTAPVMVALLIDRAALDWPVRNCAPAGKVGRSSGTASGISLSTTRVRLAAATRRLASEDTHGVLGYYFYEPVATFRAGACQLLTGVRGRFNGAQMRSLTIYSLRRGRGC
jgi:hypothetical protein